MRQDDINNVLELLYHFPRLMHTKVHQVIFKPALQSIEANLAPHHMAILKVLDMEGRLTISAIGEMTNISKAQMTHSIDRLVELKMIQRQPQTDDRRKIAIAITAEGRKTVAMFDAALVRRMVTALSFLEEKELRQLVTSLKYLIATFERLNCEPDL